MLSLSLPTIFISDSHSFVFVCSQLSCVSSHSSMLNIFAVFWNTGINWMMAYKTGWVVGFIWTYLLCICTLTHLPTPEHNTAAETVNEEHFIHSDLTKEKMTFLHCILPSFLELMVSGESLLLKLSGRKFTKWHHTITESTMIFREHQIWPPFVIIHLLSKHALWMVPPLTVAHNLKLPL